MSDLGIVSDAKAALTLLVEVAQEMQKAGRLPCRKEWVADCQQRKRTLLRKTHFDNVPVKPQRVYEEMNKAFTAMFVMSPPLACHKSLRHKCCMSLKTATGSTVGRQARWAGRFRRRWGLCR